MSDNTQPKELGKHTVKVKIEGWKPPEAGKKLGWVKFEGWDKSVKCFLDSWESFGCKVGDEDQAEVEFLEEEYQGKPQMVYFLRGWAGKKSGGGGRGGAGRGGGSWQPKTAEEIHSASVCGIIKSAFEYCASLGNPDPASLKDAIAQGVSAYKDAMKEYSK